jgi:cysteinyl-tRNA synthetase
MTLHFFDTYTRTIRNFAPLHGNEVGLYTCGPTVYDYAHIGNLRTYIFEDLLRRTLEFNGFTLKHVMNITDVGHLVSDADTGEDKMEKGSRRMGKSAWEIAEFYTQAFINDLKCLNIKEPDIWCRATEHIPEQIDLIRCIEAKGYSYRTSDGIYFDTSKLLEYGHLGRIDIEGLQAGTRIDIGEKQNPTDFALWKFSPPNQQRQMEWDSPWGKGFPGWHIECSAMSVKYLGPYFDIHCGGEDHITVHHPNEIAQTQACYGTHLANFWMHGYFLQLEDARMAKSSGDFLRLQVLIDRGYDPLAYRFYDMSAIYRVKLNFSWESLESAAKSLDRLRNMVYSWGAPGSIDEEFANQFKKQINDDLNLPKAVAVTWELARSSLPDAVKKATILLFDQVLGLKLGDWQPVEEIIPTEIQVLVADRQQMRREKRWSDADAIRQKIIDAGYEVEDTPQGPKIKSQKTQATT